MPRPTKNPQTYLAKELLSVHGVCSIMTLPNLWKEHGNRGVEFLTLNDNHVYPELMVWNLIDDGLSLSNQKEIELYLVEHSQNVSGQVARQVDSDNLKLNLGFYSSMNLPNRDSIGISIPELRPGSRDKVPTNLFCVASEFLSANDSYAANTMSSERAQFGKSIHDNCFVEGLTIARSRTVAFHRDQMNPIEPEYSFVLSRNFPSYVLKNRWVSIILYQRKSNQ